jgi:hypothetical protein
MAKGREKKIPVTAGSGNVFADLGFAAPEKALAKAKRLIRRRLVQVSANGKKAQRERSRL